MNWTVSLNKLIDYIENHIEDEITIQDVSRATNVSYYYLSRMFSMFTEMTIQEYIRNRRLSKSVSDLSQGESIIDIAIKYQYSTHEAFTKAFKRFHGVTPHQVKTSEVIVRHFPKLSFKIKVEGDMKMNYKVIEMKETYYLGKTLKKQSKQDFYDNVHGLWKKALGNGNYSLLQPYAKKNQYNSVIYDINSDDEIFSCLVGVEVSKPVSLEGYELITIPAGKFVSFQLDSKLEEDVNKLKSKIFTEWITSNDYEFLPIAEIEFYDKDKDHYEYRVSIR